MNYNEKKKMFLYRHKVTIITDTEGKTRLVEFEYEPDSGGRYRIDNEGVIEFS